MADDEEEKGNKFREHLSIPDLVSLLTDGDQDEDKDKSAKQLVQWALNDVDMLVTPLSLIEHALETLRPQVEQEGVITELIGILKDG